MRNFQFSLDWFWPIHCGERLFALCYSLGPLLFFRPSAPELMFSGRDRGFVRMGKTSGLIFDLGGFLEQRLLKQPSGLQSIAWVSFRIVCAWVLRQCNFGVIRRTVVRETTFVGSYIETYPKKPQSKPGYVKVSKGRHRQLIAVDFPRFDWLPFVSG